MRRVLRRSITTDPSGRALHGDVERIADDGDGRVHAIVRRTTTACPSCRRPVADASELRGRCDCCGTAWLCDRCEQHCGVCGRSVCGRCRRGFVGSVRMTVCPVCLPRLHQRQAHDDQVALQQIALDQHLQHQREITRLDSLRLQAARLGLMADLSGARTRLAMQLAGQRESPGLLRRAIRKAWEYARRLF